MLTSQKAAKIIKGNTIKFFNDLPVQHLLLDSRKIVAPASSLFFALKGERHNGHHFLEELYAKGVRQFVVEQDAKVNFKKLKEANILQVKNSITALQTLAAHHRSQFNIPVIGITGSNGKTIVKEWLSQLLSPDETVVKSPKSYNSQVGVPLSVWQINDNHTIGIFEAGISRPGEMERLEKIIRPTVGIFTNIGTAHDEGFGSKAEKIREKLKLFKNSEVLIYCKDDEELHKEIQIFKVKTGIKTLNWFKNNKGDFKIADFGFSISDLKSEIRKMFLAKPRSAQRKNKKDLAFFASWREKMVPKSEIDFPFHDDASIENAIHCIALLLYLNVDLKDTTTRMQNLTAVAMRLELKEGINNCSIIDDTYNNDLAGLSLALDFLAQQNQHPGKTLILSDVLESGLKEKELYAEIGDLLKEKKVNKLIGIGEVISRNLVKAGSLDPAFTNKDIISNITTLFYKDTESFLKKFNKDDFTNQSILVKGARVFEFEKITSLLEQKVHGTVLEINLDALAHNLNFFRSKLNPGTKIMVMVKAFSYGSGSYEIANLLQYHKVETLAVAYTDEGVALREKGITMPIMVMNPTPRTFDKILDYSLEPELYSINILKSFINFIDGRNIQADFKDLLNIHIKLDTGMHRLGFDETDIDELIQMLKSNSSIKVVSIFSHLAGADQQKHDGFTKIQIKKFKALTSRIERGIGYTAVKHILNSAGIIRFPEAQMDMVRLGIGLSGVQLPRILPEGGGWLGLENVGTLKTIISQIRHIKKGETIGYLSRQWRGSRTGRADRDMAIATIAAGYADGYDRRFGNGKGKVMINGSYAPVIGDVCMDMCMVDITGIKAQEGDEVILFGKDLPITGLADSIGTIPYEILTNVSERVKRVYFTE